MTVDVTYTGGERQRTASVKTDGGAVDTLPLFTSGDTLSGHVHLSPAPGKRVDHLGVKVEILGQIELYFDRATRTIRLLVRELAPRGNSTDRSPSRSSFRASNSRTRRTRASTFGFAISSESPCSARTETRRCPSIDSSCAVWASRRRSTTASRWKLASKTVCISSSSTPRRSTTFATWWWERSSSCWCASRSNTWRLRFAGASPRERPQHVQRERDHRQVRGDGRRAGSGGIHPGEAIPVPVRSHADVQERREQVQRQVCLNLVLVDEEDRRYFKQQEIHVYRHEM